MDQKSDEEILRQVTEIVAAYVSKNEVAAADLPALIKSVHATLGGISGEPRPGPGKPPAVPVKKSVKPDYIVCLEDGKKLKMLKRYLRTRYGLTPESYRAKWNLPADYPMVAPNYAARRSDFCQADRSGQTGAQETDLTVRVRAGHKDWQKRRDRLPSSRAGSPGIAAARHGCSSRERHRSCISPARLSHPASSICVSGNLK